MLKITPIRFGALFALSITLTASAGATTLMLNFRNSGGPTGANLTNSPLHTADSGFTDTAWNNLSVGDVGAGSLIWADGTTATGVALDLGTITDITASTVVDLTSTPSNSNNLGSATDTGIYAGDSVGTGAIFNGSSSTPNRGLGFQITGLDAGIYEVYVSGRNTNAPTGFPIENSFSLGAGTAGSSFDYSGYDNASITYTSTTDATSAWVEGDNYVKYTVTLAAGETLDLAAYGSARGFINSVQITTVPEPGTYAFLAGLLGLGVVIIRRRKTF